MPLRAKYKGVPPRTGMNSPTKEVPLPGSLGSSPSESAVLSYLKTKDSQVKNLIKQDYDIVILEIK